MSARTKYIIQAVTPDNRFYPEFKDPKSLILTGWTRRQHAQRWSREEAKIVAVAFENYLRSYNAPDRVEVVPANGGASICR